MSETNFFKHRIKALISKFMLISVVILIQISISFQEISISSTQNIIEEKKNFPQTSNEFICELKAKYNWIEHELKNNQQEIQIIFGMKQYNLKELEKLALQISDPKHPYYSKFLNLDALKELIGPSKETITLMKHWIELKKGKVVRITQNEDFIIASFKIIEAERIFNTTFYLYSLPITSKSIIRSSKNVIIPKEIHSLIDSVSGLCDFPNHHRWTNHQFSSKMIQSEVSLSNSKFIPSSSKQISSGEPQILQVVPGDSGFIITVIVYCKNGEVTQTPTSLCSDNPPTLIKFFFHVDQLMQTQTQISDTFECWKEGSQVFCSIPFFGLINYENATISISSIFADGSNSSLNTFQTNILPHGWITPATIRNLYSIPNSEFGGFATQNLQSIPEFASSFALNDLKQFYSSMHLPINLLPKVIGPNNETNPGAEASLDVQMIMGIGLNISTIVISNQNSFLGWILELSDLTNPPLVNSISYGEPEEFIDPNTLNRLNIEFQKLAVRGVTIISTSGDEGASDGVDCSKLYPDFPSSSPWTTSLGATRLTPIFQDPVCSMKISGLPIQCSPLAEEACSVDSGSMFTTGGGFSNMMPRPSYQAEFVQRYLNTSKLPPSNLFNSSGRAYNDVTIIGSNILVILKGKVHSLYGTSASGPIFAGIISLLNEARLKVGKRSLGFLNPLLYQIAKESPDAFHPVTSTNNRCSIMYLNGKINCCPYGYEGGNVFSTNWNPLVGLGSPNYIKLKQILLSNF